MRMHLVWDEVGEATAILDEANLALQGDAALPLWQHMLLYWLANDPTKHKVKVNEFLKKASNMENQPAICNHFRVIWLGWIVLKMAKRSPPCLQLHHKMIEYEKMQEDCNEACLRIYYVLACIHFGTDNKEIWLDYFRFEKEYGKPGQMGDLYNDACSYLNKSLVEQFKEEYNQLNK
ncbi:uncharacterized protein LOC111049418 isoform X2 [Nilaparvata lugens]|uniref:uncharacterized protein LOC111049418 isoform X2 n=1 Tax=Nilaparvata lugens TaxID=108931 RepID=UPI00193E807C|nr:uncharacterized protein LOC111049418 isoform X2 [Nilaparvata lugens]